MHPSGASSANEMRGFSISVHGEEGSWGPLASRERLPTSLTQSISVHKDIGVDSEQMLRSKGQIQPIWGQDHVAIVLPRWPVSWQT